MIPFGKTLLLFDGYCLLCSRLVRIILYFDRKQKFLFSPLSGETGECWKKRLHIPEHLDSIILIEENNFFSKSDAVLMICKKLGGVFYLLLIFRLLPQRVRDKLYDWIARNRKNWFGKSKTCMLPKEKDQTRFI